MSGRMLQETYDVLRHVAVNGPRTGDEIKKAFSTRLAGKVASTVSNLTLLGYLAADSTTKPFTYTLTGKARKKLSQPWDAPAPRRDPSKVQASVPFVGVRRKPPKGHYQAAEFSPSLRPGAMAAFDMPSRMGNTLRYRDGRVTDMAGNPITNQ